MSLFYRRIIPDVNLSVERHTDAVPHDGRFHLLRDGEIIESFRTEKEAVRRLREMLKEIGYKPKPVEEETPTPAEETLERYFYAKEMYWGESHKYREKGGKGR